MNYILDKIDSLINIQKTLSNYREVEVLARVRIEFILFFYLGILWNQRYDQLKEEEKEFFQNQIESPTIGTIIDILKKLDNRGDVANKHSLKFIKEIDKYPSLRNNTIGHGYTFADKVEEITKKYLDLSEGIIKYSKYLKIDHDLILVVKLDNDYYQGYNFKYNGKMVAWNCNKNNQSFKINNLYSSILIDGRIHYFRISPFINIEFDGKISLFMKVQERLTGRVKYNYILNTGNFYNEWTDFVINDISIDEIRTKSINGTIRNNYNKYYLNYIDVGIKNKIKDFLCNNRSVVYSTIWGNGGVGKTASVQSVCDDLYTNKRIFHYIIFLSAKDRYYNVLTGNIESIEDDSRISTFDSLIKNVNSIIFSTNSSDTSLLEKFTEKVLLIIDDFETFSPSEQQKIENFIKRLDINFHKVIITTRKIHSILGFKIEANEFNVEETKTFLLSYLETINPGQKEYYTKVLTSAELSLNLFKMTAGRPLFIIQFAQIILQKGDLQEALSIEIGTSPNAIEFLYGRIFETLSTLAQRLFIAVGKLVTDKDLSNLLNKLVFIFELDDKKLEFDKALEELEYLKVIEVNKENGIFKLNSADILPIIGSYYEKESHELKEIISKKIQQISTDKNLDIDEALLRHANNSRIVETEDDVKNNYLAIINRSNTSKDLQVKALILLANYICYDTGNRDGAIDILEENFHNFKMIPSYVKSFSLLNWSSGTKEEKLRSIKVLDSLLNHNKNYNDNIILELHCLLIQYKAVFFINDREEIKQLKENRLINDKEYDVKRKRQKSKFKEIYHTGVDLFLFLKEKNFFTKIKSQPPVYAINALLKFVDICIRLNKFSEANEVLDHVFKAVPWNFHKPFTRMKKRIEMYSINS